MDTTTRPGLPDHAAAAIELARQVRNHRIDVLHVHSDADRKVGQLAALLTGTPVTALPASGDGATILGPGTPDTGAVATEMTRASALRPDIGATLDDLDRLSGLTGG